jgi:hypothetical protein
MNAAMPSTRAMPAAISGFKKNEEMPKAAAPPSNGNAQHSAHAPMIPKPANQLLFFIYITFHRKIILSIKLKAHFKSRGFY